MMRKTDNDMYEQKSETGFTLLEVVIAVTILSVVAVGVGQALLTGQRASRELARQTAILSACEDWMRQVSGESITFIINQDGNTFTIDGVEGTGTITVIHPYLDSDGIAKVILLWDGVEILESVFGNVSMTTAGG